MRDLDIPPVCERLLTLAERHPRRAVALTRRALALAGDEAPLVQAWTRYVLGWALLSWERIAAASEHLQHAHRAFTDLQHPAAVLQCRRALLAVALAQPAQDTFPAACDELAAAYTARNRSTEAGSVRILQLTFLNRCGRPREALALAEQHAAAIIAHGSDRDRAQLLLAIASAQSNSGLLEQAQQSLAEALAIFQSLRAWPQIAGCWLERSWISQRREHFADALHDLEQALALARRLDLPILLALCTRDLGLAASRLGQFDRALAATVQARTQFLALGRRDRAATCDLNLGILAYYSGLFDLALAAYRRAEQVYRDLGQHRLSLVSQRNQALVHYDQGHLVEALAVLDQLLAPAEALGDLLEIAEGYHTRSLVLQRLDRDTDALAALQQAQLLFAAQGSSAGIAKCLLERGAMLVRQNRPAEAQTVLEVARPALADRPMHCWRIDDGLGRCAEALGQHTLAREAYLAAVETVARLRRTLASAHASSGLFQQARHLYADALRLVIAQGQPEVALGLVEQQRALALQHQFLRRTGPRTPQDQVAYAEQVQHLRAALDRDAPAAVLDAALSRVIEAQLHTCQPSHPVPLDDEVQLDLPGLRRAWSAAYPEGWLALLYAQHQDAILIFTIDAQDVELTQVPLDRTLQQLLEQACLPRYRLFSYLDLPYQRGVSAVRWQGLQQVGERLIPPAVRARLQPDLRLLIVPCGPLHALPWAALRSSAEHWLCEQAIIQLLPSLTLWPVLAARPTTGQAALLLGCSAFGERAPALPMVASELDAVAASWCGPLTRLEDAAATRQALLQQAQRGELRRYRLVHLASHAQYHTVSGLMAHIKLWDDDLLLDEVAALQLGGALVVLAACDGGVSDVLPGEEVLSLSRAFLAGGARDVVASLWPVYDQAAPLLVARFYDALAAGHDAPTALALAQRALAALPAPDAHADLVSPSSPLIWGSMHVLGAGSRGPGSDVVMPSAGPL